MQAAQQQSMREQLRKIQLTLAGVTALLALLIAFGGLVAVLVPMKLVLPTASSTTIAEVATIILLAVFAPVAFAAATVTRNAKRICSPLAEFTEELRRAASAGDFAFQFAPGRCEELNGLGTVCNALFDDIRTKETALNRAHDELHAQVKALQYQVAERKRAQAASARLTAILEATPDFVATVDPVGNVLYVNGSARRMIGVAESAAVTSMRFADFHPGWAAKLISTEGIPAALHSGSWVGETAVRNHEGNEVHVSQVIIAHRNATGGLEFFSTIMRDITEMREAEEALRVSQEKLLETSRLAGRAEVATGVLHNVGNVLNSVNVSAGLLLERLRKSKAPKLAQAAALLNSRNGDLGDWIMNDPNGSKLPAYFGKLGDFFTAETTYLSHEVEQLVKHIEHIKEVVAMQQSYAKVSGAFENLLLQPLVEDAISLNLGVLEARKIKIIRNFDEVPHVRADRHKVLQILVNLIGNARHALDDSSAPDRTITVTIESTGDSSVLVAVTDNGVGIPPENLTKIFAHGFTTRKTGHGFGLHSGALAAREMGGTLAVASDGPGRGATFTLTLPTVAE